MTILSHILYRLDTVGAAFAASADSPVIDPAEPACHGPARTCRSLSAWVSGGRSARSGTDLRDVRGAWP